jgi:hypothetical protein
MFRYRSNGAQRLGPSLAEIQIEADMNMHGTCQVIVSDSSQTYRLLSSKWCHRCDYWGEATRFEVTLPLVDLHMYKPDL